MIDAMNAGMNAVGNGLNIIDALYRYYSHEDEAERAEIGERVTEAWKNGRGQVGFTRWIRQELACQGESKEEVGTDMQILKILSNEAIFGKGEDTFVQEIIAVGRTFGGEAVGYGNWVELRNKLELGRMVKKVDDEWFHLGFVEKTVDNFATGLYFTVIEVSMEKKVNVPMVKIRQGEDVRECFDRIGRKISQTFRCRGKGVIGLAGMCGCGKSTELPRIIHQHVPRRTIFVLEARKKVAIDNAWWMRSGKELAWIKEQEKRSNPIPWPQVEAEYQPQVDLYVGICDSTPVKEQTIQTKKEMMAEVFKNGTNQGRTVYITTGALENLAFSILHAPEFVTGNPMVLIVSDWEEKTMQMASCITLFKKVCFKLKAPYMIVMASQANLVDPWKSWVCQDIPFTREYAPASLRNYYEHAGSAVINTERYNIIAPKTLTTIEEWERELFKLVKSLCWNLLSGGGCIVVKLLGKSQCYKLATQFHQYQDELVANGLLRVEDKLASLPYTSANAHLPNLSAGKGTIL